MIDETNHWQSTKAFSVYSVLVKCKTNAMPLAHVLAVLQRDFLPRYDADDVLRGVEFLKARGLVRDTDGILSAVHSAGPHRPVRLKRTQEDAELELDV